MTTMVTNAAAATWWQKANGSIKERQQSTDETQNQTIAATINWQCQKQSWFIDCPIAPIKLANHWKLKKNFSGLVVAEKSSIDLEQDDQEKFDRL